MKTETMTKTELLKRVKITCKRAKVNPHMTDMPAGSAHWRCTLRYRGRQMTCPFSQGPAICREPTAEDLLECLLMDASGADQPFEDWAGDYGYDTDSRKAERTHNACVAQTEKLKRLLGEDFDEFMAIEW
jgi:hypothetical protein